MLKKSHDYLSWFSERVFPVTFINALVFAFFWVMVGFSTGVTVLFCPVRWLTNFARENNWSQGWESNSVRLIILAYVGLSFVFSIWMARISIRTRFRHIRILLPLIWLSLAAGSLFLMLNPKTLATFWGDETRGSSRFTLGPYPDSERLKTLKEQGYSGVISLLHPAVVPFEPKLMSEEDAAAKTVGIELISAPMLPWISRNEGSLNIIKSLIKEKKGKYYIHCYLGKDRVRSVLQLIQNLEPEARFKTRPSYYTIKNISGFERGEIITLADSVYLTPYPTDDEFMSFVMSGGIRQVVSLLDPTDPTEAEWAVKEEKIMRDLSMNFLNIPLPGSYYNPEILLSAARKIKSLPRPIVVHDFKNVTPVLRGFINCFEYDKPCLASNLFTERLGGGKVIVAGPNFATGPRPTKEEFEKYFPGYGVKNFLFVGLASSPEGIEDAGICSALGMNFKTFVPFPGKGSVFKNIPDGGPWYVYGPLFSQNIIAGAEYWDEGPVVPLDLTVFLAPSPSQRELETYLVGNYVAQIACLADPKDIKDFSWTESIRNALNNPPQNTPFQVLPVSSTAYDPIQILQAAKKAKSLPRPLVLLANQTGSAMAQGFAQAYFSDKPPLLPALFTQPLKNGVPEVVAVNIVMGPRPTEDEFRTALHDLGVREFVYLGNRDQLSAQEDQGFAERYGRSWRSEIVGKYEICSMFKNGGPYYLYGPDSEAFKPLIRNYLGPPVLRGPLNTAFYNESDSDQKLYLFSSGRFQTDFSAMVGRFLNCAIPDLKTLILLAPVLVFYTMLCAGFAGWCRIRLDMRIPYTRKVFHFLIFTAACLFQVFGGLPMVVLFGCIVSIGVLYAVFRGESFPFYEAMARETDRPHRSLFVVIPLFTTALGGVLSNLFFGPFSAIGYLVGGWGDAIGEPVGSRWGKNKYRVFSFAGVLATRSYEGSIAVFFVGSFAAIIALSITGNSLGASILVGVTCGISGTLVEAFSNHGIDNLTIQVTASAVACYFLG